MAGQAHVVRKILRAVSFADRAVLAQDGALFTRFEPFELTRAAQGVPHGPGPRLVEHGFARAAQEPVLEVGLVARRVSAAEHREIAQQIQAPGLGIAERGAQFGRKVEWLFAPTEHAQAARVVYVLIDDARDVASLERRPQTFERVSRGER